MRKAKGVSLQWLLASSIVFCLLALLSVVAVQGYRGTEGALLLAANDSARQLGTVLNERAGRLLNPVESTLRLLAHDPIASADTLQSRLDRLPVLVEALKANEMLSAAYVGYDSGEFILVRHLLTAEQRQRFSAPAEASFLVQTITLDSQGRFNGAWHFYDERVRRVERRPVADYRFDPRLRPWYRSAVETDSLVLTRPYVFFTTEEVGLTMALRSLAGQAVIGMDASVADLGGEVQDLRLTPGTEMVVIDDLEVVITYPDLQRILVDEPGEMRLARLHELGVPALTQLADFELADATPRPFSVNGQAWYGVSLPLARLSENKARILIAIPEAELLSGARAILIDQVAWAAALAAVLLLIGWALGHRLGQPLKSLADQVEALGDFDFSQPPGVRSHIREVNHLGNVISDMARAIDHFQAITLSLSHEANLERMLESVLTHLVQIAGGHSGVVYLCRDDERHLDMAAAWQGAAYPASLTLDAAHRDNPEQLLAALDGAGRSPLSLALHDRRGVLLGLLAIEMPEDIAPAELHSLGRFVDALSGSLSVAVETRQLFEGQQRLLEAIIKLLADAIDAKSPYTAGHCERVPQLAEMLLDRAMAEDSGPFADFQLDEEQRYAFRLAAWLHDCGKITSPEYVVDKATKLETLYNRLHEIRTRFEVLWRDAELTYCHGLLAGQDEASLKAGLQARQQQLQENFARVAKANVGGEFMTDTDIAELHRIGAETWLRHFDKTLGLSTEESHRLDAEPDSLPACERLLADRPEHIVPWGERRPAVEAGDPRNVWGFDMPLPDQAMNLGELYNLSIRRGTLTAEERFKINDHIVQTLIMLTSLPFPRSLRGVPDIAANHHEKLDGGGYPRGLDASQLGVPDRIMAIADIFEALTAADRPYKVAKTLSESVNILCHMAADRHIDADLLMLFLSSGVYLQYGRQFLHPEQLDEVDVAACIERLRNIRSGSEPAPGKSG